MLTRNYFQPFPTPGPQEFHNIFLYDGESTVCILLHFIIPSSLSFPLIIGVESYLRAEILS